MKVTLTVKKDEVYNEVAKTAEYTGAKMADETAYETISITDEAEEMLERFWDEAKSAVCSSLRKMFVSESETDGTYTLTIDPSDAYDTNLTGSVQRSLFSFFVTSIVARWYAITNKEEAAGCAAEAVAHIENILRALYKRSRPTRPIYQ